MKNLRIIRTAIACILSACLLMVIFIWINFNELKANQIREFKNISLTVGQTASSFVSRRQYDNFVDLMSVLTRTSVIQYMALYLGGEKALQSGTPVNVKMAPWTDPGGGKVEILKGEIAGAYYSVLVALPYHPSILRDRAAIHFVFPLKAVLEKGNNVRLATGVIVALLLAIIFIYATLEHTYRQLQQAEAAKTGLIHSLEAAQGKTEAAHSQLKRLEQKRAEMVMKITHDSKNYLTLLNGIGEQYSADYFATTKQIKGEKLRKLNTHIKWMKESTLMLINLAQNLDSYEKVESHKVQPTPGKTDLMQLLKSAGSRFDVLLAKRDIQFQITEGAAAWVWADPALVDQVIVNLYDNAIKYSRVSGNVKVWIHAGPEKIKTLIQDEGPGISGEDWERIFQPFNRLIPDTPGTGLGLSNARELIRCQGGELGVERSEPGCGTTFYFWLPSAKSGGGPHV